MPTDNLNLSIRARLYHDSQFQISPPPWGLVSDNSTNREVVNVAGSAQLVGSVSSINYRGSLAARRILRTPKKIFTTNAMPHIRNPTDSSVLAHSGNGSLACSS